VTRIKKIKAILKHIKEKKSPFNCKGFITKPKMGKGSIKIASTQNATRQLNWLPTYTLFENMKLIHFKIITEQCSRYDNSDQKPINVMNIKA